MTPTRTRIAFVADRRWQASFVNTLLPRKSLLTLIFFLVGNCPSKSLAQTNPASFDAAAARASAARESGRIADALQAYRVAVEARPDWDEGWWYLGTLNYDANHFADSVAALQHFVKLDPNVGAAWAFLGLSEFETAAYEDAFNHLQRAQKLGFAEDPSVEKVAIYHLALLLNRRGTFDQSARSLVKTFGSDHLPDQIKIALGLALLRVPLLPSEVDPSHDALLHAAGNAADLLAHQDFAGASLALRQMLMDFPSTPYLHYAYGLALMTRAQFEQADAQFREEGRITPRSAMSQVALSSLNLKQGQVDEAVACARNAVKIDPDSADAYEALAQALRRSQRNDQAADAAEKAQHLATQSAKLDPVQAKFYALADGAERSASLPNAGDAQPHSNEGSNSDHDFEAVARAANEEREANHVADAVALYQHAVQLRPGWQEGWRQLGTLLFMQQSFTEAAAALERSVAMESKQADTWTLLGLSEFELKDYKNALLHLKKGQALGFGGNAAGVRYARYHLALLLNLEREFDAATDLLIPEAHLGPLFDDIQFAMGLALLRMPVLPEQVEPAKQELVRTAGQIAVLLSESRYDSAFPIFEKLLQQQPETPFLHYSYGDALAATSEYNRALVQLREENRINPNALEVQLRVAAIALRLDQPEAARDSAKTAVSLAPDSPDAHYLLGRSYLESGDTLLAITELETARRLAPGSPAVHFNLARAYAKAKRADEAQKERDEFQRLNVQLSTQSGGQRTSPDGVGSGTEGGEALAPSIAK